MRQSASRAPGRPTHLVIMRQSGGAAPPLCRIATKCVFTTKWGVTVLLRQLQSIVLIKKSTGSGMMIHHVHVFVTKVSKVGRTPESNWLRPKSCLEKDTIVYKLRCDEITIRLLSGTEHFFFFFCVPVAMQTTRTYCLPPSTKAPRRQYHSNYKKSRIQKRLFVRNTTPDYHARLPLFPRCR